MNFKVVTEKILSEFRKADVRYALIGGFALSLWGVPRGTVDLDFLVRREDMEKVHPIMTSLGYECRHHTENVSQYVSPLSVYGEVDFLHAFRSASLGMLERATEKPIFDGHLSMRVALVEDIIGLKVQAMANDESRKGVDMADVESLMTLHGSSLDWSLVGEYFELFDLADTGRELRRKYSAAF